MRRRPFMSFESNELDACNAGDARIPRNRKPNNKSIMNKRRRKCNATGARRVRWLNTPTLRNYQLWRGVDVMLSARHFPRVQPGSFLSSASSTCNSP